MPCNFCSLRQIICTTTIELQQLLQGCIFCHVTLLVLAFSGKKLNWNCSINKKVKRPSCREFQTDGQIIHPCSSSQEPPVYYNDQLLKVNFQNFARQLLSKLENFQTIWSSWHPDYHLTVEPPSLQLNRFSKQRGFQGFQVLAQLWKTKHLRST